MAVIVADDSNFESELSNHSKIVVKYYADWCGTCKLFSPKYKRLAGDDRFKDIVFLDINAETSPEARKKAGVNNLPTFATFKNGELVDVVMTSKEEAVVEILEKIL